MRADVDDAGLNLVNLSQGHGGVETTAQVVQVIHNFTGEGTLNVVATLHTFRYLSTARGSHIGGAWRETCPRW